MSERTKYEPGTPSWVDLGAPDPAAAAEFYSGLFGWDVHEAGPAEETGGYRMAYLRDKAVAGLGPQQNADAPPYWTTYVSVADAEKTAALVAENGGTVIVEPFDVLDAGRMAVFFDPAGAAFSVWEPKQHIGAQIVNEPGALAWNELNVRDAEAAKAFYGAVFGWEAWSDPAAPAGTYYEFKLNGSTVAGMLPMNDQWPAEMPNHWMVYFATDDTDATAAKAVELGGKVSVPPTDIPPGRFAVLQDQQGAVFSVIKFAPSMTPQ